MKVSPFGWLLRVDVAAMSNGERDLVIDRIWGCDPLAIEERGGELVVGFAEEGSALLACALLEAPSQLAPVTDDSYLDAWRQHATAQRVGDIVVRPPWVAAERSHLGIDLIIDPGRAFGSGGHASTQLALSLLQHIDLRSSIVLDMGCGSGVLAIAALRLGASVAYAVDIDPAALIATQLNATRNGVADRLVVAASADDLPTNRFDVTLVNVLPSVHKVLAGTVMEHTRRCIIASGALATQHGDLAATYSSWRPAYQATDDPWLALALLPA